MDAATIVETPPVAHIPPFVPEEGEVGTKTPPTFAENLAAFVASDAEYHRLKTAMEKEKETCDIYREICKAEFEKMGVSSMKSQGKTVFISHQIWAGTGEGATTAAVIDELRVLGLNHHLNYNTQSFSSYVREVAKEHPELCNAKGEIIAEPAQILAVLPGELSKLCKVTDKLDLKIRKS